MRDKSFLEWLHARLCNVYGEDPNYDFMHKLRAIISTTPTDRDSGSITVDEMPNVVDYTPQIVHEIKDAGKK